VPGSFELMRPFADLNPFSFSLFLSKISFLNYGTFELADVEFIPSYRPPLVSLSYILLFLP